MLVPLFISFAMMSFSSYAEEQANKPIGQMSFKWRKNYVEATTTGASISDNQNTDNTISETTEPATTDNQQQSTAFGTTDNNNTTNNDADKKNPYFNGIPIMDCLHKKCHDLFMDCFNDDTCKDFMKEWQKKQSLSSDCLPADKNNNNDSNDKDINVVETTNVPNNESSEDVNQSQVCKYSDEFWHMYECGVRKYCYNDQRDLIKAHNLIISPSYHRSAMNHHLDPTNTNSYTKWTLVLVASLSAFLVVILYTLIQRLRKDKVIACNGCSWLDFQSKLYELYTRSKIYRFARSKYHRPHHDLRSIEEEDDEAMYGMQTPEKRLESDKDIALESSDCESQQCGMTKVPISSLDQQTEDDDESEHIVTNDDKPENDPSDEVQTKTDNNSL